MKIEEESLQAIHNFCDSWCNRCLFTQNCRSYTVQTENGVQSTEFNQTLVQQLTEALALTKQYINAARSANAPDNPPIDAQYHSARKTGLAAPGSHPIALLTQAYLHQTGHWLTTEKGLLERVGYQQLHEVRMGIRTENEALTQLNALKDAWQMIKWYRTLIPIKTTSALRLFDEPTGDIQKAYYTGKVKLVLVSIDRSLLAWQTVITHAPEKIDELLDMLALLNRVSRELETLFPEARAFKRPGLD